MPIDVVYVAASALDGRSTRICVASIRYFYPDIPIRLLIGGELEPGLLDELARYWGVEPSPVPPDNWGWGFVKLEPLFLAGTERFLVLDSDTVLCGYVLDRHSSADFIVDCEDTPEEAARRLYYEYVRLGEVGRMALSPDFLFNSGQWFGRRGVLRRTDFEGLVDWSTKPPCLIRPDIFKNGEQGVLNLVLNEKQRSAAITVERRTLMVWPGNGMQQCTAANVSARRAPARIVHWAGIKAARFSSLTGADLLMFFEHFYYSKLPQGRFLRAAGRVRHALRFWSNNLKVKAIFRVRMLSASSTRIGR